MGPVTNSAAGKVFAKRALPCQKQNLVLSTFHYTKGADNGLYSGTLSSEDNGYLLDHDALCIVRHHREMAFVF